MFTHIAMFRIRPDVDEAEIERVTARLEELPALVPDVKSFTVGRDARISDGNWDMVVIAGFEDEAGYRAYAAHPDHQPVIMEVRHIITERAGIQFED